MPACGLAARPGSLLELVAGLNHFTCEHSLRGMRFTTAFLAELNAATHTMEYVCAGHNAPILQRNTGGIERLSAGDVPLAIDFLSSYQQGTITLGEGDCLIVFTDGLIEAVNPQGDEYGESRLLEAVGMLRADTAQDSLRRLMALVDAFVGHAQQHDDLTSLILRIGKIG